jgi:hypothetical protein
MAICIQIDKKIQIMAVAEDGVGVNTHGFNLLQKLKETEKVNASALINDGFVAEN